jgi:hypothetical protein
VKNCLPYLGSYEKFCIESKGNAMATGVGCYMDRRYDLVGRQVDLLHGSPPVAGHIGEFLIGCDRDLDRSRPGVPR